MSLRLRLLAITLVMVAAGLTVAGWATYHYLRPFLVDKLDQQLLSSRGDAFRLFGDDGPGHGGGFHSGPPGLVAQIRTLSGQLVFQSRPDLRFPTSVGQDVSTADLGPGDYRIVAAQARTPQSDVVLVTGLPLHDVNATMGRVLMIELIVGASTLGALGALGFWLVRLGLRPLHRIEETAGQIAAGDLSRRVDDADPRTEVGRLGAALNAMLTRIEAAFAEREASERRLRQFVADASHELQTPLTSVRGYAELFRRGASERPGDLATAMRRIEAESTRMGVLVDDLLLLARLDQGRPMEREPVDLRAIAADLVGDARAVEPDRPIELLAEGPVVVTGDEHRLRQVVANLLTNARVHTPRGAPVTVRVAQRGSEAVTEVTDSGPGIPSEHAARVFERFFRADPSRARASGGSGLGLSIVAAIAESHGGRAEVESPSGRGATFRVTLPLAAAEPADTPQPVTGASRPSAG